MKNLCLGPNDARKTAQAFKMCQRSVGNECGSRADQSRQVIDFTGVVHPHLDDGKLMMFPQAEQGQRDANMVIEIAGADVNRAGLGKNGPDHFLDRGFPVTAGHTDHRDIKTPAPVAC